MKWTKIDIWVDRHPVFTVVIYVLMFLAAVTCVGGLIRTIFP